jgi:hypothetical protein
MEFNPEQVPRQEGTSCSFPDCPSNWVTKELVTELRKIQDNQVDQRKVQEKMLEQRVENASFHKDILYMQEDLKKIDGRLTQLFVVLESKVDDDDIIPKDRLVTKADVGRLMVYTAGLFSLVGVLIQIFGPLLRGAGK